MTGDVVGLRGDVIYQPGADEEVVGMLEDWLEKARSGEVVGVALAALYRDKSVGSGHAGIKTMGLIGELFSRAMRIERAAGGG